MIRQAETKDIPMVLAALQNQLAYIQKHDGKYFTEDDNQYIGGIIEYVAHRMNNPNHIVLTDGKAILIGMVEVYPGYLKHRIMGFIEHVYPISFSSTPLVKEFYRWAQEKGATAVVCLVQEGQEKLISVYERQGFKQKQTLMIKEI